MTPATSTVQRQHDKRGIVVSNKMTNTVVVVVNRYKLNQKYQKRYLVAKKYYADTAGKQYQIGEEVSLSETRPISKLKRWVVVESHGMGRYFKKHEQEKEVSQYMEAGATEEVAADAAATEDNA